jgi:hypothetical protein
LNPIGSSAGGHYLFLFISFSSSVRRTDLSGSIARAKLDLGLDVDKLTSATTVENKKKGRRYGSVVGNKRALAAKLFLIRTRFSQEKKVFLEANKKYLRLERRLLWDCCPVH